MYVYVVGVRIKGKSVSFAEPYVLGDKGGREVLSKFCRRAKSRTRDPTSVHLQSVEDMSVIEANVVEV